MGDVKNPSLWKTTIIIWTEYNPESRDMEIDELASEAIDGDAYCSHIDTIFVKVPEKDPNWDDTEFFLSSGDEDEEEEDEIDLVAAYEQASGNKVVDDVAIVDSRGMYMGLFTEDMAMTYLGIDAE